MTNGIKIDVPSAKIVYEKKKLKKVLRQAGQEIANVARRLIRGSQSPSRPFEAPGSITGKLASSIAVRPSRSGLSVSIVDNAPYALALEGGAIGGGGVKGSRNKRKRGKVVQASTQRVLQPRPFLSSALDQRQASLSTRIKESILGDLDFRKIK